MICTITSLPPPYTSRKSLIVRKVMKYCMIELLTEIASWNGMRGICWKHLQSEDKKNKSCVFGKWNKVSGRWRCPLWWLRAHCFKISRSHFQMRNLIACLLHDPRDHEEMRAVTGRLNPALRVFVHALPSKTKYNPHGIRIQEECRLQSSKSEQNCQARKWTDGLTCAMVSR